MFCTDFITFTVNSLQSFNERLAFCHSLLNTNAKPGSSTHTLYTFHTGDTLLFCPVMIHITEF